MIFKAYYIFNKFTQSEFVFKFLIIGGGVSGLACGYYFRLMGLNFKIVERGGSGTGSKNEIAFIANLQIVTLRKLGVHGSGIVTLVLGVTSLPICTLFQCFLTQTGQRNFHMAMVSQILYFSFS